MGTKDKTPTRLDWTLTRFDAVQPPYRDVSSITMVPQAARSNRDSHTIKLFMHKFPALAVTVLARFRKSGPVLSYELLHMLQV